MSPLKQQSLPRPDTMQLRLLLPARVLVEEVVTRLVAEAENGSFGVLPRHVDFLAALRPGVLVFENARGIEGFVGHDVGIFVKRGAEVLISVHDAVQGDSLASLRDIVEREFVKLDQRERTARTALARLEAGVVRRFIELEEKR